MAEFESKQTTDHDTIRRWAEERGGRPARIRRSEDTDTDVLRIDFLGGSDAENVELEPIGWEEFFRIFDEKRLALLYRERTSEGDVSTFSKFTVR